MIMLDIVIKTGRLNIINVFLFIIIKLLVYKHFYKRFLPVNQIFCSFIYIIKDYAHLFELA